ncbi:hypothetical protein NQ314_001189 [Rhamnusium bicolor]|uniref:Uncharacterized protein n=1 Tax=Rhamnusium bicolor TaxID=1586634 RepID=A0AAV8ZTW6_9CUCU|nr:hypothetical protein NQ314_001189 [Rhamnusium bicolor]
MTVPLTESIERRVAPGPTTPQLCNTKKQSPDNVSGLGVSIAPDVESIDSETEKQVAFALKKAVKDTITLDGRLNIVSQIDASREALCCKYSEEFDYIAAGYADGVIKGYNSSTGEEVFSLSDQDVKDRRAPVTSIKHRPVTKIYPITNYANGCVKCWSYNFNQCLYTIKEKRQTFGITYHPRVPKFVTYGDDLRVYFYDEESKIQERVLMSSEDQETHDGHMSRVFAACFHPRNNYELITGGWDDVVQFWDLRQPHAIRHLSGIHMCGEGLDINSKGTEVLTCAYQGSDALQIFDYGSGKKIVSIEPDIHSSKLYCGKFTTKDFIVTGGSDPNILRVIDIQTTATSASINYLPGAIYSMDMGPPKKKVERGNNNKEQLRLKGDISVVPKIAFVSAKKLYQIDFY